MKAHERAEFKLKLVGMYQRGGMGEIENYLIKTNRDQYLKKHQKYRATLEGAEISCKEIIGGSAL